MTSRLFSRSPSRYKAGQTWTLFSQQIDRLRLFVQFFTAFLPELGRCDIIPPWMILYNIPWEGGGIAEDDNVEDTMRTHTTQA